MLFGAVIQHAFPICLRNSTSVDFPFDLTKYTSKVLNGAMGATGRLDPAIEDALISSIKGLGDSWMTKRSSHGRMLVLANNAVTMMSGSREITPLDISIADIRCQLKDFLLTDKTF